MGCIFQQRRYNLGNKKISHNLSSVHLPTNGQNILTLMLYIEFIKFISHKVYNIFYCTLHRYRVDITFIEGHCSSSGRLASAANIVKLSIKLELKKSPRLAGL